MSLASIPSGADEAVIRVTGGQIRMRGSSAAPTTSVGFPLNDGDIYVHDGPPDKFQFIRTGAVDVTLDVMYSG